MLGSKSKERKFNFLFAIMFGIVCLLHVNYAILRSARSALAVADLGGGASSIPWFELCGTMPGAVLMTFGLTWLINRFSIQRVFLITIGSFVAFFLFFVFGVYPFLPGLKQFFLSADWIYGHDTLAYFLPKAISMIFFVMAELWKIALVSVLFWGFINQYVPVESAKKYYAPLMLGGSLGTIAASPLISLCTSDAISGKSWGQSLTSMMLLLTVLSAVTTGLFFLLFRQFQSAAAMQDLKDDQKGAPLSVWQSFQICLKSPFLLLLGWITIADYVAYTLGEVIFLDVLKQKFPDPREYCNFMGKLSFWNGLLTAASALFLTPILLRRCRWVVSSLATPICLLIIETAFFFILWHPIFSKEIDLLVIFGSLLFVVVRTVKYTLFDTSKEISFLLLPPLEKMQGKLVIDGMCARVGKGGASLLSLILIQICGGVLASAPVAGGIALAIATTCVAATAKLGTIVDKAHRLVRNDKLN